MGYEVTIYAETSCRGPSKRPRTAMWLVEFWQGRKRITRQGFLHLDDCTEAEATLKAITAGATILTKACLIRVKTSCGHILNTAGGMWYIQWEKNGWKNAKGNPVKNAELWQEMLQVLRAHSYSFSELDEHTREEMKVEIAQEEQRWQKVLSRQGQHPENGSATSAASLPMPTGTTAN